MRSKFIPDPQDPVGDGVFNAPGDWINPDFFTASSSHTGGSGAPSNSGPALIPPPQTPTLPDEAVEAQTAVSGSGSGGPGSVVAETAGSGITINLIFDAAAMAAPASFRAGIEQAASILSATITNKITVNLNIDYGGTGGGAAAGPDNGQFESYSTVRSDLINNAAPGDTSFNALPTGSTIQGQSQVAVWNAQLKLWGLLGANDATTDDGSATFATDISSSLLVGVALHELTHALGRVPYGPQPDIFDFYRFTSVGTRLFTDNIPAATSYFSLNGGTAKLADYGKNSDPSDFLNSGVQGTTDPFNEFYSGSTIQSLTTVDKEQLDALGFNTITIPQSIVVAATASQSIQGGAAVTLLSGPPTITDAASSTLSSATIKVANGGGNAVAGDVLYVNGLQNGLVGSGVTASWNGSTDTLTLTGSATIAVYNTLLSEVSFQDTGTDASSGSHPLRTITWTVNDGTSNFSTTSQIAVDRAPVVTAANVALSSGLTNVTVSSLFTASDPDGDAITTYAFKDTGNGHFVLNGVAQANNQEIDVTAAQLSLLTYQNAIGTDSLQVRANDGTLWSAWQSFSVTGPVAIVIQTNGTTALTGIGNNYYLYTSGSGPELKFGGVPVVPGAGQFSGWAAIGAVQTSTGYDVAWKDAATNQYAVWTTDTSGNFVSSTGAIAGTSTTLETYETSLNQDLNGDGVIGIPTVVIQTDGSTSLVQVGSNYFLDPVGGSSGPELKFGGVPVVPGAGQFSGWAAIGAVQTSTGYDVAWKDAATNQYAVWTADSSGNFLSSTGAIDATSTTLEAYENTLHQDLNGDGTIGIVAATVPASQVPVVSIANSDTFVFAPDGNTRGTDRTASAPPMHLDSFAPSGNQFAFFHEAQTGQPEPHLQWTNAGTNTVIDLGHHDGPPVSNFQLIDLHASHFIIS
jgi:serralysin